MHRSLTLCVLIIALIVSACLLYFKEEQASHIVSMLGLVVGAWVRYVGLQGQQGGPLNGTPHDQSDESHKEDDNVK